MGEFGRYHLIKPLGATGIAEAFVARGQELEGHGGELVVERLHDDLGSQVGLASTFIGDAKRAIVVRHPNVAQVTDFGQTQGAYYLARHHVRGFGLDSILRLRRVAKEGMPPHLALLVAQEILSGLDALHHARLATGVMPGYHLNLRPTTVLVAPEGTITLTGLAMGGLTTSLAQSDPRRVAEQVAYLAPEQLQGRGDAQSDVYACGAVLWEMLTGRRMAQGESLAGLLERVKSGAVESPARYAPQLPKALVAMVLRAVAPDKALRFDSAQAMGREVMRYLLAHHGDASLFELEEFLQAHQSDLPRLESPAVPAADHEAQAAQQAALTAAMTRLALSEFKAPEGLDQAVQAFRQNPRLWRLVEMADVYRQQEQGDAALAVYRAACVLFAHRGLLAQSLLCCKRMLELRPMEVLRPIIVALPMAAGCPAEALDRLLYAGAGPVERLLQEMLGPTAPSHGTPSAGTPLLSYLDGIAFADLAHKAPLRTYADATCVVREGENGHNLFLIGRGRVVVYATNVHHEPVYLSSLTEGDFFGENSFFTGAPRSATVETLGDVEAFEIDKALYEKALEDNARAEAALLDFYKERIVNAVLAKSEIFGVLPGEARQNLVEHFALRMFGPGETIIVEGEPSDQIYLIKSGQAEVSISKGGPRTVLSTLGPGSVFGEVAALRRIKRTASVTATRPVEALQLQGQVFQEMLQARPDLGQRVHAIIAQRARENLDKLWAPTR